MSSSSTIKDECHSDDTNLSTSTALIMKNDEKDYTCGEDDGNNDDLDEELPLTFPQRVSVLTLFSVKPKQI
jgi:hypothetical protein